MSNDIFFYDIIVIGCDNMGKIDYLIIYGCHKKNILNKRLNHALKIINDDIDKIVLTGGIGLFGDYNESEYMKEYLLNKGIDKNKLILEDKSRTTKENNINVINMLNLNNNKSYNIKLVSNKFHLFRIKRQLKKLIYNKNINFYYEIVK